METVEKESAPEKGVLRKRDLIVLIFAALSIYLSLDSTSLAYTLTPCWYLQDQADSKGLSKWARISPIITDLDGDGSKEVVIITKDMKIKVLSAEPPNGDYSDIYSPELLRHNTLSSSRLNVRKGRAPVAMQAGYISRYSDSSVRQQVIVVLREDWTVVCFDSALNILWEKAVGHKTHQLQKLADMYQIDEASIAILPLSFTEKEKENKGNKGIKDQIEHKEEEDSSGAAADSNSNSYSESDSGIVIIGGSMKLKEEFLKSNHSMKMEHGLHMDDNGHAAHADMYERSALEHFSTYALSARDGQVIWKHDGSEIRPNSALPKALPQHLYNLDKRDLTMANYHGEGFNSHHGNRDWSLFRTSLMEELPHRWDGSADTSVDVSRFERHHIGTNSKNKQRFKKINTPPSITADARSSSSSPLSTGTAGNTGNTGSSGIDRKAAGVTVTRKAKSKGVGVGVGAGHGLGLGERERRGVGGVGVFSGVDTPPLSQSAVLPHSAREHEQYPNVVVAHTKRGVEAISLKTGTPVTALSLPPGRSVADLDGDGIVDMVVTLGNKQEAVEHSGQNWDQHKTKAEHCTFLVLSGLPARSQLFNGTMCRRGHSLQEPNARQNAPGTTHPQHVSAAPPLVLNVRDPRTNKESSIRDVVIAVNSGVMTTYSGRGIYKWQLHTTPQWPLSFLYATTALFDADADRVDVIGNHRHLHAQLLVVGDKKAALISRDGHALAEVDIPKEPISRPVLGDFDNDGVTDVLILTEDAVLGYRLEVEVSSKGLVIATLILIFFAFIFFLSNIKILGVSERNTGNGGSSGNGNGTTGGTGSGGSGRSRFSLLRATDDGKLD